MRVAEENEAMIDGMMYEREMWSTNHDYVFYRSWIASPCTRYQMYVVYAPVSKDVIHWYATVNIKSKVNLETMLVYY